MRGTNVQGGRNMKQVINMYKDEFNNGNFLKKSLIVSTGIMMLAFIANIIAIGIIFMG